jgi:hypothetical protein
MSDFYKALSSAIYVSRQTLAGQAIETDDQKIRASGLYEDWAEGKHTKGEVYNADDQTWECYQDYDNAVYPDIRPGEAAWFTFNRPLHGKTRETARPWVKPMGAHDMYHAGEWMVWTDNTCCECIAENGTNFSPEEYPAGWRKDDPMDM